MNDELLKSGLEKERSIPKGALVSTEKPQENKEIRETSKSIIEGVEEVGGAEEGGTFAEDDENDKGQSRFLPGSSSSQVKTNSVISELPPIEEMVKQTIWAIEAEMRQTKVEVNELIHKKAAPYDINFKVKRIRFLNNLLSDMKRAAKMAEEYVVNLWKQFVRKSG